MSPTPSARLDVQLPPLTPWQEKMIPMLPLAEALAERVVNTLCLGCEPFSVEDAQDFLYHHLMKTTHTPDPEWDDDDEGVGNRMSASNDAALLIGFALGRRIGGGR